jgi:MtN3 and saliva related transmembrane protein
MTLATFIGLAAATLTTVAFVPQVVRAWRTRSTHDISLPMFLVLAAGITLWLIYGAMIRDLPLVLANLVTLVLVLMILLLKLRYK